MTDDSSDDGTLHNSNKTPSKLQTQRHRMEKLCRLKKMKANRSRRIRQNNISSEESEDEEDDPNFPSSSNEENSSNSDLSSDNENDFVDEEQSPYSDSESEKEKERIIKVDGSQIYANPYMERNDDIERQDIMKVLSKSTEKDKDNHEKYRKEIGKYQLQIHSETNPALYLTKRKRYKRIMKETRHDESFKEERNIGKWDDEYYNNHVLSIRGTKLQIFPHTRVVAKYSFSCDLKSCKDKFIVGETNIVGTKIYSKSLKKFISKRRNNSSNESFYWICASHCPPRVWKEESCSSYSSEEDELYN